MAMNGDIQKFYQDRFGGIERLVTSASRQRVPSDAVLEACETVYEIHQATPYRSIIIIGQRVLATARAVSRNRRAERSTTHDRAHRYLDTIHPQLDDIVGRITALEVKASAVEISEARIRVLDRKVIPRLDRRLRALEYRRRNSIVEFLNAIPYYG